MLANSYLQAIGSSKIQFLCAAICIDVSYSKQQWQNKTLLLPSNNTNEKWLAINKSIIEVTHYHMQCITIIEVPIPYAKECVEDPIQSIYTPVLRAPLKYAAIKVRFYEITYEMRSIIKQEKCDNFLLKGEWSTKIKG